MVGRLAARRPLDVRPGWPTAMMRSVRVWATCRSPRRGGSWAIGSGTFATSSDEAPGTPSGAHRAAMRRAAPSRAGLHGRRLPELHETSWWFRRRGPAQSAGADDDPSLRRGRAARPRDRACMVAGKFRFGTPRAVGCSVCVLLFPEQSHQLSRPVRTTRTGSLERLDQSVKILGPVPSDLMDPHGSLNAQDNWPRFWPRSRAIRPGFRSHLDRRELS